VSFVPYAIVEFNYSMLPDFNHKRTCSELHWYNNITMYDVSVHVLLLLMFRHSHNGRSNTSWMLVQPLCSLNCYIKALCSYASQSMAALQSVSFCHRLCQHSIVFATLRKCWPETQLEFFWPSPFVGALFGGTFDDCCNSFLQNYCIIRNRWTFDC